MLVREKKELENRQGVSRKRAPFFFFGAEDCHFEPKTNDEEPFHQLRLRAEGLQLERAAGFVAAETLHAVAKKILLGKLLHKNNPRREKDRSLP